MAYIPPRRLQAMLLRVQVQQQQGAAALAALRQRNQRRQRRRRQFWVRPWIQRRPMYGNYENLMLELERESRGDFVNFMRMEPRMFHELLLRVTPRLTKQETNYRRPLDPGLKLAITLRYMASGNSYRSLSYSFRVPYNTISGTVKEVAEAILAEYEEETFDFPTTPDRWRQVAEGFEERWNFPHVCGALDGKHIAIKAPRRSGTMFYKYKGFFSIVLLALVDSNYKFLWADVGSNGSSSDCGVFNVSPLRPALESGDIGFPAPSPMTNDDKDMPFFLVGDDAFPLRTWMMKPFSHRGMSDEERIYNYRLSRARRIVENAFGILAHRWRCLLTTMQQEYETVKTIACACLCLHNLMRARYPGLQNRDADREGPEHNVAPGAWRTDAMMQEVNQPQGGNHDTKEAKAQRIYLKHYLNNVGSVPWQGHMI